MNDKTVNAFHVNRIVLDVKNRAVFIKRYVVISVDKHSTNYQINSNITYHALIICQNGTNVNYVFFPIIINY